MTRLAALLLLLVALLGGGGSALAQNRMTVSLVPEADAVLAGETVTLAFVMRPAAGWHGYWRNPGDAGAEPRVAWRLPEGWRAEPLQYPVPDRLIVFGLMNYVFERDYALLATLRVPQSAEPGVAVPVDAQLDFLVCTDQVCVPETAHVSTELRVGVARSRNPDFEGYRRALPRPLGGEARFATSAGRVRIAIPLPAAAGVTAPYFFPATADALGHSSAQSISRDGDLLIVETQAGAQAGSLQAIEGVLEIGDGVGLALAARRGEVPAAGTPVAGAEPSAASGGASTILLALLGALVGGLLLNIMPCVFPILSLKALSLARAGESDSGARVEALAYAGGVILTCLALGGLLLALRASGEMVGWAFQLQDPRVILLLFLLVSAIALNLAGLFQLPMLAGGLARAGTRGAFLTGALAAFVATPCTGPFLGFALGAALVLPTWAALAVFAGLGLGLALPFLALGYSPALRRRLPRPGAWMERLQRILSVPMFLTALGLAWILGRQTGVDGMTLGLAAALLLGLGLWWFGRRGGWLPLALVALAVAAPLLLVRPADAGPAPASPLGAEPFSEARLAELRAARTPVFVYFTADWCLTCKVNERAALDQTEVVAAFRARGIKVLVGDWTRGDAAIGRFLERHGRSGVPLYLYYPPGGDAEILPQILTVSRLTRLGG